MMVVGGVMLLAACAPAGAHAALEVSGWLPYWKTKESIAGAKEHIDVLSVVHPFVFTVAKAGTIKYVNSSSKKPFQTFTKSAQSEGVLVVPTIMTADTSTVYSLLSDKKKRKKHIDAIIKTVKSGKFDGIDIDYEGKSSRTAPYFALFLEELKDALGDKMLSCTIEARTPPESLYHIVPDSIEYANDYDAINEHCDKVNIMAYDQQRADIKLNKARKGLPYAPVSDTDWVEKVIAFTVKDIDKEKLNIGVATYGYEWQVSVEPEQFARYTKLWSLNPSYALTLAKDLGITPTRNNGGEIGFSYIATTSKQKVTGSVPKKTKEGDVASLKALATANKTGEPVVLNVVTWTDAESVAQKVALAEKYGLQGIALFRIDGGEDPAIWNLFE